MKDLFLKSLAVFYVGPGEWQPVGVSWNLLLGGTEKKVKGFLICIMKCNMYIRYHNHCLFCMWKLFPSLFQSICTIIFKIACITEKECVSVFKEAQ